MMPNTQKVLIHSNYSPQNHGGVEFVVSEIIRVLSGEYKIKCFFGAETSGSSTPAPNLQYIRRKILLKVAGASFLSFGNLTFIHHALSSSIIIFQEPYPILWPSVWFLRAILKKKIIVLVHADPVSHPVVMRLYGHLRSNVFRGATHVFTSPVLQSNVRVSDESSSLVIPLSIRDYSPQPGCDLTLPARYVLYFGRLASYKGIEELLEAAKLCKNVNFIIAGDGPLAGLVYTSISSNKLPNVIFINRFITEEEKYFLIERSSFVVFPSTSENEAFGLVQLEAMKSKRAIVNTQLNSGVNFVAPDGICAITVEPKSSIALAKGIRRLWDDIDFSQSLGESGYLRYSEVFHESLFSSAWLSLLGEATRS